MPTYVYACTECGHRFEAVQSFTDDSLTECPECEGRLRKVFNSVGVVFKGSGFYKTDSRSTTSASTSTSTSGSSTSSSDSSGSAAKPSTSGSGDSSSSTTATASTVSSTSSG